MSISPQYILTIVHTLSFRDTNDHRAPDPLLPARVPRPSNNVNELHRSRSHTRHASHIQPLPSPTIRILAHHLAALPSPTSPPSRSTLTTTLVQSTLTISSLTTEPTCTYYGARQTGIKIPNLPDFHFRRSKHASHAMRDGWIGADMRVSWGEIGGKRVIRWVGGAKAGFGLLRRVRKRIIHGYGVGFIGGG